MDFDRMISYCAALEKNNDRKWFHENHKYYEEAKADFEELLELMRFTVAENAPKIADSIMHMQAKDWMYRIPRDARLYKNGPPYEPSFRAFISGDRRSWRPIGYFISIAPEERLFGTGIYITDTSEVNRIRRFIAENYDEFARITAGASYTISGEKLKKTPCGYSDGHPASEIIKHKNWMISVKIPKRNMRTFEGFCRYIGGVIREMEPIRAFMLEASGMGNMTEAE